MFSGGSIHLPRRHFKATTAAGTRGEARAAGSRASSEATPGQGAFVSRRSERGRGAVPSGWPTSTPLTPRSNVSWTEAGHASLEGHQINLVGHDQEF